MQKICIDFTIINFSLCKKKMFLIIYSFSVEQHQQSNEIEVRLIEDYNQSSQSAVASSAFTVGFTDALFLSPIFSTGLTNSSEETLTTENTTVSVAAAVLATASGYLLAT